MSASGRKRTFGGASSTWRLNVRFRPEADTQIVAEYGKMVCEILSLGACIMILGLDGYGSKNDLKNKNQ